MSCEIKQEALHKVRELMDNDNRVIKLNKKYWIAQWSWSTICDGMKPSETTITFTETTDAGDIVYMSKFNYRKYLNFQICDTKEQAQEICDTIDSFGYSGIDAIDYYAKDVKR